mgnify:CR=1 FL=1
MPELKPGFIANMRALLGEEAGAFFRALEEAPTLALRPHRGMEAAEPFIEGAVPWAAGGFYLRPGARPGASVAHWAGAFYLQEASAMLPAAALKARSGERVLDLCAAPGGKSSQIALSMGGEGVLVANEVDAARARVLAANLERLGVTNAVVLNETPARLAARWPESFDAVLVDAPCSGEGMFRRDPQSREAWTDAAPRGCRKRQGEILEAAAKMVRPGGRLLYSTCTFNGEENEGSVADFLQAHADFAPEDFALPGLGASRGGMLRIWPHRARGDGQFVARLRKAGDSPLESVPAQKADPAARALLDALHATAVHALPAPLMRARLSGGRLFAVPARAPETDGMRVLSSGTALLRVEKNRVEPEHALAMALAPGGALRVATLCEAEARAFLAGEALAREGEPGWTLATYAGLPLGWGKQSGETLKNHLPKGLRRALRA